MHNKIKSMSRNHDAATVKAYRNIAPKEVVAGLRCHVRLTNLEEVSYLSFEVLKIDNSGSVVIGIDSSGWRIPELLWRLVRITEMGSARLTKCESETTEVKHEQIE